MILTLDILIEKSPFLTDFLSRWNADTEEMLTIGSRNSENIDRTKWVRQYEYMCNYTFSTRGK